MNTFVRALFNWLAAILRRHRGRRQLAQLDDRMLRDIGLTRYDIRRRRNDRR